MSKIFVDDDSFNTVTIGGSPVMNDTTDNIRQSVNTPTISAKGVMDSARNESVTITDHTAPMVVLFGPPTCGKTMTLVRLARYLQAKYCFKPDQAFRDSSDSDYEVLCNRFNKAVNSDMAADGTKYIEFMLLRVNNKQNGKTLCQFVESPGEFLFDPNNPNAGFPAYLNQIAQCNNRRIWVFFLEPGMSSIDRKHYVARIQNMRAFINNRDKIVFVTNKVDMPATSGFITSQTSIDMAGLYNYMSGLYAGLFNLFPPRGFWLWKSPRFGFTAFQTGTYVTGKDANGQEFKTFQAGHDSYPARLWEVLYKCIKG